MSEQPCCVRVWHTFSSLPCRRKAKVEREGKWYCTIHDPVRMGARRAERSTISRARRDLEEACRIANGAQHNAEQHVVNTAKECRRYDVLPGSLCYRVDEYLKAEQAAREARVALREFNEEHK